MMHHPNFLFFVIETDQVRTLAETSTSCPRLLPVQFVAESPEVAAVPVQIPTWRAGQSDVLDLYISRLRRHRENLVKQLAGSVSGEGEADTSRPCVTPVGAAEAGRGWKLDQRGCREQVLSPEVGGAGQQGPAEEQHGGRPRASHRGQ